MKNAEKYNDELLKHVCGANPTPFAIVEKTGEFTSCLKIKCSTCKFYGGTNDCNDKKIAWLNQEYIEPAVISKSDLAVIQFIKDDNSCIIRRNDGKLWWCLYPPVKKCGVWFHTEGYLDPCNVMCLNNLDLDLPMVSCDDKRFWSVSKLKQLPVVEQYKERE